MNRHLPFEIIAAKRAGRALNKKPLLLVGRNGRVHVPAAQRKADSEARRAAYWANRQAP